ncbi:hypothetical protein OUZ56_010126 [Daphnia magna]|uniref:Uncharacterized protein n=1 Tax=Daphnia magna TaxID=35525 RepID=A0ABR0AHV6_9CRUS|nr:hypothetical protein OUZ56_010126 [Daphnia magna]
MPATCWASTLNCKLGLRPSILRKVPCSVHSLNLAGTSAAESCATTAVLLIIYDQVKKRSLKFLRVSPTPAGLLVLTLSFERSYPEFKSALEAIAADSIQTLTIREEANGLFEKFDKLETAVLTMIKTTVLERMS